MNQGIAAKLVSSIELDFRGQRITLTMEDAKRLHAELEAVVVGDIGRAAAVLRCALRAASRVFSVKSSVVFSRKKTAEIVGARTVVIHLCERAGIPDAEIARLIGKDRSTVFYARKATINRIETDKNYTTKLEEAKRFFDDEIDSGEVDGNNLPSPNGAIS
jgi:chromosomal replication initiation ATPase DnaA